MNEICKNEELDTTMEALMDLLRNLPKDSVKILNVNRYEEMLRSAARLTVLLKKKQYTGGNNH